MRASAFFWLSTCFPPPPSPRRRPTTKRETESARVARDERATPRLVRRLYDGEVRPT